MTPGAQQEQLLHQEFSSGTSAARRMPNSFELLVSAAVSGLVTKTACAPMDRLRLLYQVQGMLRHDQEHQRRAPSPTAQEGASVYQASKARDISKYGGIVDAIRVVVKEEGIRGLWKGNGVNAMRAAACYAIKFPANDLAKRALGDRSNKHGGSSAVSRSSDGSSLLSLLLAGAVAGSLQKSLLYPLDLLSVRIAVGVNASALGRTGSSHAAASCGSSSISKTDCGNKGYRGVLDCAKRVWLLEGPRGFFKGYSVTLWSGVPYVMLQMTVFDLSKRILGDAAQRRQAGGSWPLVLLTAGVSGSAANMAAQAIVFPFDTIRKRLMNDGIDGRPKLYSSTLSCFNAIRHTEGFRAFYYGIWPATLRSIPAGAIQFASYELMKELFLTRTARATPKAA